MATHQYYESAGYHFFLSHQTSGQQENVFEGQESHEVLIGKHPCSSQQLVFSKPHSTPERLQHLSITVFIPRSAHLRLLGGQGCSREKERRAGRC